MEGFLHEYMVFFYAIASKFVYDTYYACIYVCVSLRDVQYNDSPSMCG